jgi:hypothetical protein
MRQRCEEEKRRVVAGRYFRPWPNCSRYRASAPFWFEDSWPEMPFVHHFLGLDITYSMSATAQLGMMGISKCMAIGLMYN